MAQPTKAQCGTSCCGSGLGCQGKQQRVRHNIWCEGATCNTETRFSLMKSELSHTAHTEVLQESVMQNNTGGILCSSGPDSSGHVRQ